MFLIIGLLLAGIDAGLIYAMAIGAIAIDYVSTLIAMVLAIMALAMLLGAAGIKGGNSLDFPDFGGD